MGLKKSFADWLTERRLRVLDNKVRLLTIRLIKLEDIVAADTEMLARLNTATSRVAARLANLVDQVTDLRGQISDDIVNDAEALRPVVEQLEALGKDAANPVPEPGAGQVATDPEAPVAPEEDHGVVDVPTGENADPINSAEPGSEPSA